MTTEHEQRLTLCNRKLVEELAAHRDFARRLLNPDDLGHAVSQEVRTAASRLMDRRDEGND